jgi:flagellar hook-associated protein 3 FlgL
VHDLAIQANSAAMDSTARAAIATELKSRVIELQDLANRRDANGEYLFAGLSTQTQPFQRSAGGVSYVGDQGIRAVQISADQKIIDGFSGQQAFQDIPQGNGSFTVAAGVHVGASSIDSGQVTNPAAWVPGTYSLQFTTASSWQVVDATSAVVASGAYTSGSAINFNGAQVTVSGAPAAGDSYGIAPAGREDVFTTIDKLVTTLTQAVDDPVGRSTLNTEIAGSLTQIDQALTHMINLRAEIGARLSTVDTASVARQQLDDTLTGSVGKLQDLDYAAAVSTMNQQLLGLQAAQQAYGRIAQLSLFNYL